MFAQLKERIEEGIPRAVAEPIASDRLCLYDFLGITPEGSSALRNATVSLMYVEIAELSGDETDDLTVTLVRSFNTAVRCARHSMAPGALSVASILLEHEKSHCTPFPREIRARTVLDATVVEEPEGLCLWGNSRWPPEVILSNETIALSYSEPSVLTFDDENKALRYAHRTGNLGFIGRINQRIQGRLELLPTGEIRKR